VKKLAVALLVTALLVLHTTQSHAAVRERIGETKYQAAPSKFSSGPSKYQAAPSKFSASEAAWAHKAAAQGDARAQLLLSVLYYQGDGVPQDDARAAYWCRKAAEQGNASAQFLLGGAYLYGRGAAKDDVAAAQWWKKSAEQGNADAQQLLGLMHVHGRGVIRDRQKGCGLLRASAKQGNKDSSTFHNDLCAAIQADVSKTKKAAPLQDEAGPPSQADASQAELKKRLDDEIAALVRSAEALGAMQLHEQR
jgi:TPR repeat protein